MAVGAYAVCGIYVAIMGLVVLQTPVVGIVLPIGFEVMDIGTLGVDDLSEESLLCHIECRKFKVVVTAVLQYGAMYAVALRSIHELPALCHGVCTGYFDGNVLATLHSV